MLSHSRRRVIVVTWIVLLLAVACGTTPPSGLRPTPGSAAATVEPLPTATSHRPSPTSPPPPTPTNTLTPPAPEQRTSAGTVTGQIDYPGQTPTAGLNLFFENIASEEVTVVPLEPGAITYTAILSPGIYLAYTWSPDFVEKGAHTACRPGEVCQDYAPLPITVTAGVAVSSVDVDHWVAPEEPPLLLAGTLFDGTGADPLPDAVLIIREERIVAVGPRREVSLPDDVWLFDLPDSTILPGFINTHVHNTKQTAHLTSWAQAGVTTVRDVGERANLDYFGTRDRLRDDPRYARILAAGPLVTVPDGYPIAAANFDSLMVISPNDARKKIGRLIDKGADVIKITLESTVGPVLDPDTAAAIVETAHERGIPVTVHATQARDLKRALDAGVDDIAHSIEDHVSDELLQHMIDMDVSWVPTLEAQNGRGLDNLRRFVEAGGAGGPGQRFGLYRWPGTGHAPAGNRVDEPGGDDAPADPHRLDP